MAEELVDLRSDTVTRPTAAMREAMAWAEVGDDVYGEDPTVNALEEEVAALVGKEAALWVPTGVMANQIALWLHGKPGAEILAPRGAHCLAYESGAAAGLSGLQIRELGDADGVVTAAELGDAIQPAQTHLATTAALVLENTHNRAGGRILQNADELVAVARARGLATHLDGARLWNAAAATGRSERELAAPFDTVSVCLSKGLGAPAGSLLCAPRALMARARYRRKMLGGGMRQVGILAAAGRFAIAQHRARLSHDHRRARMLAEMLGRFPLDVRPVETNIVAADLRSGSAAEVVDRARAAGVLIGSMGPKRIRAVTHLDVDDSSVELAAEQLAAVLGGL
jgi:threonine aldolase